MSTVDRLTVWLSAEHVLPRWWIVGMLAVVIVMSGFVLYHLPKKG